MDTEMEGMNELNFVKLVWRLIRNLQADIKQVWAGAASIVACQRNATQAFIAVSLICCRKHAEANFTVLSVRNAWLLRLALGENGP